MDNRRKQKDMDFELCYYSAENISKKKWPFFDVYYKVYFKLSGFLFEELLLKIMIFHNLRKVKINYFQLFSDLLNYPKEIEDMLRKI